MKKITEIFVLAIASMVALSSCEKQNAINNENTVLKASFEDMTKTALGTEYQVLWSATDEIALFDSEGTRHISTSTTVSDGGLTAEFGFGVSVTSKIALFPADEEASCNEGGVVSTTLPTTQYPVAGGFDPKANIALSETVDNTAKFYNACTLIGFTIKNDDIKSITLRSDKALAGDCLIYMNSGVPEFSSHATDPSDLVLEADFENGKTYYAVVFPSEYGSFDVTFKRADGKTATFENNNTLDLTSARSCITNFFDLEIPDSKWESSLKTTTSTFTDKNWNVGTGEEAWTASGASATSLESSGDARGVQTTLANIKDDGLSLTNSSIKDKGAIKKVEILYSSNCGGNSDGTISVAVGSTQFGETYTIKKEKLATISFENDTAVKDDIVITFTSTAKSKSVYVKSITVTYAE